MENNVKEKHANVIVTIIFFTATRRPLLRYTIKNNIMAV